MKEASAGLSNNVIAEQLREVQKDIEKLELEIKPFKESSIELVSEKDL